MALVTGDSATLRMAVVGPFSSGKSALINALVGESVVPMGVTPLTAVLHRFRWSATRRIEVEHTDGRVEVVEAADLVHLTGTGSGANSAREVRVGLPAACLKDVEIWDTPGFGSNALAHEVVARKALMEADVVLWVTPIDHALDRSEAEKLARLKHGDTPVVLAVNKADLAENDGERDEAVAGIAADAGTLASDVVWVSARTALQAGSSTDARERSGMSRLEPLLADLLVARLKARREHERAAPRPLGAGEVACPDCRIVAQFDDQFCVCGRPLADQHRACPRCKKDNAVSRPRCRSCNLEFSAWERGELLAAQAESEIDEGLFLDALASLELALGEEPAAPGREARRRQVEEVASGIDALFRSAGRGPTSKASIGEWERAEALYRTLAKQPTVFVRRLGEEVVAWCIRANREGPDGVLRAARFATGRGAVAPALSDLQATARRDLALLEYRATAARAVSIGLTVPELPDDAALGVVTKATTAASHMIATHEAEIAAASRAAEATARAEAVNAQLRKDALAALEAQRLREAEAEALAEAEAEMRRLHLGFSTVRELAMGCAFPGSVPDDAVFRVVSAPGLTAAREAVAKVRSELATWQDIRDEAHPLQVRLLAVGGNPMQTRMVEPGGLDRLRAAVAAGERAAAVRKRKRMAGAALALSMALGLTTWYAWWLSGERDQAACVQARDANTVAAWAGYLGERPSGRCAAEAADRSDAIPCEIARAADSVDSWTAYLSTHVGGRCAAEATDRIEEIPCEIARTADSVDSWTAYLSTHVGGRCAEEATWRLASLPCEIAAKRDSVEGWTEYLRSDPSGSCAGDARHRLEAIPCERLELKDRLEEPDRLEAWVAYLSANPAGPCSAEATARIQALPCLEARRKDSLESWTKYLQEHPGGSCASEAAVRIRALTCGPQRVVGAWSDPGTRDGRGTCEVTCVDSCVSTRVRAYSMRAQGIPWGEVTLEFQVQTAFLEAARTVIGPYWYPVASSPGVWQGGWSVNSPREDYEGELCQLFADQYRCP